MKGLLADTHAALWYLYDSEKLSPAAIEMLDTVADGGGVVYVSAISLVEVVYLSEKGRLGEGVLARIIRAIDDEEVTLVPVGRAIAEAVSHIPRSIVPDMPDRIIAATALHLGLPLVTRDRMIRAAGIETIWQVQLPRPPGSSVAPHLSPPPSAGDRRPAPK